MKLQHVYEKKEDVPQDFESLYTEKDGKFELTEVEGLKTQADIDRLQEAARKERDDHKATKDALNEVNAKLATAEDQVKAFEKQIEEGGLKGGKDAPTHEDLVKLARLERENEELKTKSAETQTKYDELSNTVTRNKAKDILRKEAAKHLRPECIDREVEIIADKFEFSDKDLLTRADLEGINSLKPEEFFPLHVKDNPYLAIKSNSGGAGGGANKPSPTGDGPVSAEDYLASKGVPNS